MVHAGTALLPVKKHTERGTSLFAADLGGKTEALQTYRAFRPTACCLSEYSSRWCSTFGAPDSSNDACVAAAAAMTDGAVSMQ
jgi:hypothetical protein